MRVFRKGWGEIIYLEQGRFERESGQLELEMIKNVLKKI